MGEEPLAGVDPPPTPSATRKLRPLSLNHSPVDDVVRQNSTALTPGSSTNCNAPNAGKGLCNAFSLYTVVPGGFNSGGRSCHSSPVDGRITPQCKTKPGFEPSHSSPIVCTPWALVFTVARICVPSPRGMAIRSVTSPRIAARGVKVPRPPRLGRTPGLTERLGVECKARRVMGSDPTRRDLRFGGRE